jgi:hypothetical protein
MVTGEVLTLIVIIIGRTALRKINEMERGMYFYLEWQLNVILRHCATSKLASSMILPDLGLIHPWFSLNCYDNFTALRERGCCFASLVLVSASSLKSENLYSRRSTRWNERYAPTWSGSSTLKLMSSNQMEQEMCSYLEWQLNVNPTKTLVQQSDGTRDVLLAGVAARHRSHNANPPTLRKLSNSHPAVLQEINQMEREMCSYLEWQLNSQTRVQQPDGTRDVLLAGVAARRQSHNADPPTLRKLSNSCPATR